ncbi:hypothetical protein VTL71DRAFT_8340 [Oculimacula yallundae]|uniref:Uncharacterized protein n=1 Tax=Oculimacula yallundae TaxID=86028 RepID=A0ABR4CXH6_9HELO
MQLPIILAFLPIILAAPLASPVAQTPGTVSILPFPNTSTPNASPAAAPDPAQALALACSTAGGVLSTVPVVGGGVSTVCSVLTTVGGTAGGLTGGGLTGGSGAPNLGGLLGGGLGPIAK